MANIKISLKRNLMQHRRILRPISVFGVAKRVCVQKTSPSRDGHAAGQLLCPQHHPGQQLPLYHSFEILRFMNTGGAMSAPFARNLANLSCWWGARSGGCEESSQATEKDRSRPHGWGGQEGGGRYRAPPTPRAFEIADAEEQATRRRCGQAPGPAVL